MQNYLTNRKCRVSAMNIHLYALKMASLIDGFLHMAVFSELIGEFNYCQTEYLVLNIHIFYLV
jgi:hypothetical protein